MSEAADKSLSEFLKDTDGFYRATIEQLAKMHYDDGLTHHDIAEKFGVSIKDFSVRMSKAGVEPLCDTCREKIDSPSPAPEYCSEACQKLANGEPVVCSDCGEEIKTVGRWKAHNNHVGARDHYERFAESVDGRVDADYRSQRKVALHRAGGECEACGDNSDLEVHHIIKRRVFEDETTAHALENLCVLCQPCHRRLESKTMREVVSEVSGR